MKTDNGNTRPGAGITPRRKGADMASKNYEVLWDDGFKVRVRILNKEGIRELEDAGFYFDDFYGDGTEKWTR